MTYGSKFARCFLLTFALLSSAPAVRASDEVSGLEARNEAVIRRAFEAWSAGTGHVFDILSPDVRWTIAGSGPFTGTFIGKEDFRNRAAAPLIDRLAAPLKPRLRHVWTADDRVIVRFDASSKTTSGAPYGNQYVWILKLADGQVVEGEAFLDMEAYRDVVDNNEAVLK